MLPKGSALTQDGLLGLLDDESNAVGLVVGRHTNDYIRRPLFGVSFD